MSIFEVDFNNMNDVEKFDSLVNEAEHRLRFKVTDPSLREACCLYYAFATIVKMTGHPNNLTDEQFNLSQDAMKKVTNSKDQEWLHKQILSLGAC